MFILDVETSFLITIVWIWIVCTTSTLVSLHIVYHVCSKESSKWIAKRFRNLTVITAILFTLSSIADFVHISFAAYSTSITFKYWLQDQFIIATVADSFYFIGDISFYVLILMRIYIPFEVNKHIIYFLSFLIIVSAIVSVVYCIGVFLFPYNDNYFKILITTLMCNDFILDGTIWIIFVTKMKRMITGIDHLARQNKMLIWFLILLLSIAYYWVWQW